MGLKAAAAEREVMRLGKGTEWPGLAQGHYRHRSDPWGEPTPWRSRVLGCRPSPLLLPWKLRSLSEQEAARRAHRCGAFGDAPVFRKPPTELW